MQRIANAAAALITALVASLVVAGCNANSDAVKVLETDNTSLRATVDSFQNMGPTMTAQASILTDKLTAAEATITAVSATNAALMSQMNANTNTNQSTTILVTPDSQQPVAQATPGSGNSSNSAGSTAVNPGDSAFTFASVVTAKGQGGDGCAMNESSAFSTTDSRIWVIADVRNYKRGTVFTVNWSNGGDFSHQNTWTVPNDGAQICVHFYIEPKTLSLKAGTYTVTMSTPAASSQPVQFTIQDASAAAQPTSATK